MEESSQLWKEESCGVCVQHDEAAIHRESEFTKVQGAVARVVDQGDSSQPRSSELLGV